MQLDGAHVLITGASRGIGAAMARSFAASGAKVSVAARSVDALAAVATDIGGTSFAVDLLDPSAVDALIPRVEAAVGPVDVLVNNAGVETTEWLRLQDPQGIRDAVRLNLEVPMVLTRAVLPGMLTRGSGSLVYTSSLAGTASFPAMTVYSGTKGGLTNFAGSVRLELRDTPLRVTLVAAGPVDTDMWDRLESRQHVVPILRRLNALHLIPKTSPEVLARRTVAAVRHDRRHVRVPRRLLATYWLGESPRRITEWLLAGVPFDSGV